MAAVLQGVVELVAPTLSPKQEKGLADAIDNADRADWWTVRLRSRNYAGAFATQGELQAHQQAEANLAGSSISLERFGSNMRRECLQHWDLLSPGT